MVGYAHVLLRDMAVQIGEDRVKAIISNFSCPLNSDVEYFLRNNSLDFDVPTKRLNSKMRQRIRRLAQNVKKNTTDTGYLLAMPLIAQIGKNFYNGYNRLISGDELLEMAVDCAREGSRLWGGKLVYLECEDIQPLLDFYQRNLPIKVKP